MHFPTNNLLFAAGLLVAILPAIQAHGIPTSRNQQKLLTVITTDMEQDDLASLIRYLLYSNDLDTQGIIYSASQWHWAGDGKGTEFYLPGNEYKTPQTSWRWTGTETIQEKVIPAYAEVYQNLLRHDPSYPSPETLLSKVKIGNIVFEGEMSQDTDGSNLIKSLLLDEQDPRPVYLQVWGGPNTVARALASIEEQFNTTAHWAQIKAAVSRKAVIMSSGFQDATYVDYISVVWPQIRVENLDAGYALWAYNCNSTGQGNIRGDPDYNLYFTGPWTQANIEMGPYGSLYRSWLDGQHMPGDQEDVWGNRTAALIVQPWCPPLEPYAFLSEGDNVAYFPLLTTGIQDPANPNLGSWGGRAYQNSTSPDLWLTVPAEEAQNGNGTEITLYTDYRWVGAIQNDFAARMQWTVTSEYSEGNHAPSVRIAGGRGYYYGNGNGHNGYNGYATVPARAGSSVSLAAQVSDPDGDHVTVTWWQYFEEGTYPGEVAITTSSQGTRAVIAVPADAKVGQTISIILQGVDNGDFPLTRYDRVFIRIIN